MSGNSGTQSLAVSVRNISTGEIDEQSKFKVALREAEGLAFRISLCHCFIYYHRCYI